ncbi:MAG: penicillin-binding protein 2 [Acidimicrobiia bacterium]|nr:penicillin-binding protein 2 [Acidimicrobiia bacterium]
MTEQRASIRSITVVIIAFSLFAALLARLWFLQVVSYEAYALEADENRTRELEYAAPRGRILDRNGDVIVENRLANVIAISGDVDTEELQAAALALAPVLGQAPADIVERYKLEREVPYAPVVIASDVPDETMLYIAERGEEFANIEANQRVVRSYPLGNTAAHVLGILGGIDTTRLDELTAQGYLPSERIGKNGIEAAYETELRGTPKVEVVEVDRQNRAVRTVETIPAIPGDDVVTTLDIDVQLTAERALRQGIYAARTRTDRDNSAKTYEAPAGAVVVLDAKDGSVVAMASYPIFEIASIVDSVPARKAERWSDPAQHSPLTNRAIGGAYAPGSTFKWITAIAGLRAGVVGIETAINDPGYYDIGGRPINRRYNAGRTPYGSVALRRALTVSSDVYFYRLGETIWNSPDQLALHETAQAYGFGEPSGIELLGEIEGNVPTPTWKEEVIGERWYAGDNVNLSIGQGYLEVTPLQLAVAYAALANGGDLVTPHLASKVVAADGEEEVVDAPIRRRIEIAPEVRDVLIQGLTGVVTEDGGTGKRVFEGFPLDRYPVWAKTGTAQVGGKQDSSVFAAVVAADGTEYVVVSIVEQGGFGASTSGPIAREVADTLAGVDEATPGGGLVGPDSPAATLVPVDPDGGQVPPQPAQPASPETTEGEPLGVVPERPLQALPLTAALFAATLGAFADRRSRRACLALPRRQDPR